MLKNTLATFIANLGMTAGKAAVAAGIERTVLYKYVNDPYRIPCNVVTKRLCEHYQVQPTAFVRYFPEETKEN